MPEKPPSPAPLEPTTAEPAAEGPEIDAGPLRYHPGDAIADKYRLVELLGESVPLDALAKWAGAVARGT